MVVRKSEEKNLVRITSDAEKQTEFYSKVYVEKKKTRQP